MYATSPDRFSFMIDLNKKRLKENISKEEKENLEKFIKFYEDAKEKDAIPSSKINLEKDLRSSEYIVNKCKKSETYSQNLYAALCNNQFLKDNEIWSCSWRHSGGVVSNLREEGDYINWYCSGMPDEENTRLPKNDVVQEGFVTEEIKQDLYNLGWKIK